MNEWKSLHFNVEQGMTSMAENGRSFQNHLKLYWRTAEDPYGKVMQRKQTLYG